MSAAAVVWVVSIGLFVLGLAALILRRQLLAMVLGLELMINAANLNLVYHASASGDPAGLAAAALVLAIAAAEIVVGLCLVLLLYRRSGDGDTASLRELCG